jgi:dTDP-4-dehydrorhamnose reductase
MILLLGASGYMGQAFATELRRRRYSFIPLTRKAIDYTDFDLLFDYIRKLKPEFIINAAGYPGRPNVDACETAREETLFANTLLPQTIARACSMTSTPWGHISSGCIYHGARLIEDKGMRIVEGAEMRQLFAKNPEKICGYTEWDEPNFSFRNAPCNFYSGTKALAEEAIRGVGKVYLWRPGMPFNERSEPRNYLWRIQNYPKVFDGLNSLSHLEEFVRACLDLWERQAPFGIYNMTNPGAVLTRQVVEMIERILKPNRRFEFWKDEEEFYRQGARALRSNCILDVSKLLVAGIKMRPVEVALEDSLRNWNVATLRADGAASRNVSLLSPYNLE